MEIKASHITKNGVSKPTSGVEVPLVSVIIPCYNHGIYLPDAIRSIEVQDYPNVEIIVVDDGSTDNTKETAANFPTVTYVYQHNQGLSAARNTGAQNSRGELLVFLDADDLLLPHALACNVQYLQHHPAAAFVSGGHELITADGQRIALMQRTVNTDHYINFLKINYIGMHGTVMYRRWVFGEFAYDVTLRACEDYDLYLKVARKYPVVHHTEILTAYRMHSTNMSGNNQLMLTQVVAVLKRQERFLQTAAERKAYKEGMSGWKNFYCGKLYVELRTGKAKATKENLSLLRQHRRQYYFQFFIMKLISGQTLLLKKAPDVVHRLLNKLGLHNNYVPSPGKVRFGDFNRTTPINTNFGVNRGGAVDRYYIENFLAKHAAVVKGRVLEVGDDQYTRKFGGENVQKSEVLDVDANNDKATFIGDLSNAGAIPDNSFDCFILTQTLQYVFDLEAAIKTCYRVLKPGGSLLLTVPGIGQIGKLKSEKENYLWSFTDTSIQRLLTGVFPQAHVQVKAFGNVLSATAFLYGLGLPEIKKASLDVEDPYYQVIITAAAKKPV